MYLFLTFTIGFVLAGIAIARVDRDVALVSGVTRLAEAGEVTNSGFVTAHCAVRAWVLLAVRLLDLTVDTGVAVIAFAS